MIKFLIDESFPSARKIFSGVNGMSVSGCAPSGPQRVVDRVHHAGRRAGGAGLAGALGAEFGLSAVGETHVAAFDVGHLAAIGTR